MQPPVRRAIWPGPLENPRIQSQVATARLAWHECLPFIAAPTIIGDISKIALRWIDSPLKSTAEHEAVAQWLLLNFLHRGNRLVHSQRI